MRLRFLGARLVRKFIDLNFRVSRWENSVVSHLIPRKNGMQDFSERVIPGLLQPGLRVLEVGAGRSPLISAGIVQELRLHVVGLDISQSELLEAPEGSYSEVVVGDVIDTQIPGPFDLILSRTVLEHVKDNCRAIANLTRAMADGAVMAHFVPNRRALFAAVNRYMGNQHARRVLYGIYPERKNIAGFKAYYHQCVPSKLKRLCMDCGLEIVELTPYFRSDYFEFFTPIHTLEICRQIGFTILNASDLAETFVLVARKPLADCCRLSATKGNK